MSVLGNSIHLRATVWRIYYFFWSKDIKISCKQVFPRDFLDKPQKFEPESFFKAHPVIEFLMKIDIKSDFSTWIPHTADTNNFWWKCYSKFKMNFQVREIVT